MVAINLATVKYKHQAIYALAFLFVYGCAAGPSKGEVEGLNKRISRLEMSLDERVAEVDELKSKFRLLREKLDENAGGHALEANGITPPPGLKIIRLGEKSTLSIKGLPDEDEAEAEKAEKPSAEVEKTEAKAKTEKGLGSNPEPPPSETTPSAETMYKKARELFLSGRFSDARIVFQDLATAYPESSLADNAFYWSAESYFRKKNFNEAIVLYKIVVDRYPEGNKAADALWGIGASYLRLGDAEKARASWERILKEYPDSEAAASASKRLE
ncbi:MAG: tol-pal system protein YbgF [Thermodesulfobacteriota bacterium]